RATSGPGRHLAFFRSRGDDFLARGAALGAAHRQRLPHPVRSLTIAARSRSTLGSLVPRRALTDQRPVSGDDQAPHVPQALFGFFPTAEYRLERVDDFLA